MRLHSLFLAVFLFGATTRLFAQPGSLDTGFNGKGIKEFSFVPNLSNDKVTASFLQPDGKLLVALSGSNANNAYTQGCLVRVSKDGKLDNTFGIGGRVEFLPILKNFFADAITLRPNGDIILGGYQKDSSALPAGSVVISPTLVSLNADGSKDDLFGETVSSIKTGYRRFINANYSGFSFYTVQVHPTTGNIYASGATIDRTVTTNAVFMVTAWNRLGNPINSFGSGGYTSITPHSLGGNHWASSSVLHVKDNTLFVAGASQIPGNLQIFSMTAVNINTGIISNSFNASGTPGKLTFPLRGSVDDCTAIRFSADSNSFVLAGYAQANAGSSDPNTDFLLFKRNKDGSDFSGFPSAGMTIRVPGTLYNYGYDLEVLPNGKMVIGGSVSKGNTFWSAIRVNADGTLDNSSDFGLGKAGYVLYDGQSGTEILNGLGIAGVHYDASTQQILFAGQAKILVSDNYDGYVKRVNFNGSDDKDFGTQSLTKLWTADNLTATYDLAVRSDGKVWVCGNTIYGPAVALFNADGSLSSTGIIDIQSYFPTTPTYSNVIPSALVMDGDKLIVAGQYVTAGVQDIFIIRLNSDGTHDKPFKDANGIGTAALVSPYNGNIFIHDIILQPGIGYTVYGYTNSTPSMLRFKLDGTRDMTFNGGSGIYSLPNNTLYSTANYKTRKIEVKKQADGKLVAIAAYQTSNTMFMIFRLNADGTIDNAAGSFGLGSSGIAFVDVPPVGTTDIPTSLVIRDDQKILVGGYVQSTGPVAQKYAFAQLKSNGTVDTDFGSGGTYTLTKGFANQTVGAILLENSNTITVAGSVTIAGNTILSAFRISGDGKKTDNTFSGNGHVLLGIGSPRNAALSENSIYIAGTNRTSGYNYSGQLMKLKVGTGPVVKITDLALPNYTKTFGDEPFTIKPVTNSPATVYYAISNSDCATIHPATGVVKITCATEGLAEDITVRAVQPAVTGYTADTATATIKVLKANPRILFTSQGGLLGATFTLAASTNSGTSYTFTQIDGAEYVSLVTASPINGAVLVNAIGVARIRVNVPATNNYLAGSVIANIYGYDEKQAPEANDDKATLAFGEESNITIDVLKNDAAYTGVILVEKVDLDPSTPLKVDSVFVSPSLGLFRVDSTGIVTYTPFTGFIGSGSIAYTIRTSDGQISKPGNIRVEVAPKAAIPDLKATELITPNNDGLNEAFVIGYVNLEKENSLTIFDRNGQQLFSQTNYKNDWTGELTNGKQAEPGIYYYLFTEGNAGGQREIKGVVEIRR